MTRINAALGASKQKHHQAMAWRYVMVGITLSPEQIRAAPPEVRRWLEHELAVSLGLNPPALPITQPTSPHLAACTPEEAAQVLSLIQGMLPVVHVFFELGREGAAPSEGIEAFRLADIMRHTRLEVPDQVLACLEVLDQAVQRVRNDPSATFHAVDERGYCLVAAQTQRSIRAIWQQLVAQRELVRPADSSHTEGRVSARLAPDLSSGGSSFLTASPSGPAVPLHKMAPSTSPDRLSAESERRAPSPPTIAPSAPVVAAVDHPHAPSPSGQAEQQGEHGLPPGAAHAGRKTGRSARKRKGVAGRKGRLK
ncbi:MAG: hypothetical protein ACXU87_10585 [Xanthobacteraceae bacterium]